MNPLTYHEQELQERINKFNNECEIAIDHIRNLKQQARSFLNELACEPRELKARFLRCTRQLDEFMYHITEFNLSASKLENTNTGRNGKKTVPTSSFERKASPSHSNKQQSTETKHSRTKQKTQKLKNENWRESCATPNRIKEDNIIDKIDVSEKNDTAAGSQPLEYPRQLKLTPGSDYEATIVSVDGSQLWLLVDAVTFMNLSSEMAEYYKQGGESKEYTSGKVCAYYDEDNRSYFRAMHIRSELEYSDVILVDTGEFVTVFRKKLRALHPRFCVTPPLAHLCYLADVDQTEDATLDDKKAEFLEQMLQGGCFKMKVITDDEIDDPRKPPLVYLYLEDGTSINELLVQELASNISKQTVTNIQNDEIMNNGIDHVTQDESTRNGGETDHIIQDENARNGDEIDDVIQSENGKIVNELNDQGHTVDVDLDEELDYSKCSEYENPVEAVTGYSNRDEMEICKHYTGGRGCFKGARCKKRHVHHNPDGWTLDRMPVIAKCRPAALPPPGSWHKVKVTHVDDSCRLYVQFEENDDIISLADMVEDMTKEAANSSPLQLVPAPGELVSARFEDNQFYRARVLSSEDHKAEVLRHIPHWMRSAVFYIDFGNTSAVSLAELRALPPRWCGPPRAQPARLAGLRAGAGAGAEAGAGAAAVLKELALNKIMEAQIIARDYDELTVTLLDSSGFDLAEQLAIYTGITLHPYSVEDDSQRRFHHVPA